MESTDSLLVIGTCREQRGCVARGRIDLFPQPLDPDDRSLALSVGTPSSDSCAPSDFPIHVFDSYA
jgi:hypothetical protein